MPWATQEGNSRAQGDRVGVGGWVPCQNSSQANWLLLSFLAKTQAYSKSLGFKQRGKQQEPPCVTGLLSSRKVPGPSHVLRQDSTGEEKMAYKDEVTRQGHQVTQPRSRGATPSPPKRLPLAPPHCPQAQSPPHMLRNEFKGCRRSRERGTVRCRPCRGTGLQARPSSVPRSLSASEWVLRSLRLPGGLRLLHGVGTS